MATKKSLDWPQVVMVLGIGALAVYAVGHIDAEKLAAIPAETWALIASALAGVVGTVFSASRGRAVRAAAPRPEPKPVTPDLSDEPLNEPTPSGAFRTGADARERETDPGAGFVSLGLLIAIPICAFAVAVFLSGCGAGALAAHARASSIAVVALQGADELAETSAELAIAACSSASCTDDVVHATEVIDAAIATTAIAVQAYVQAVELAVLGGESGEVLQALVLALLRLMRSWSQLAPLYAALGVELPQLPASIGLLSGGGS